MNLWVIVVGAALALTACQPADKKVGTVKERLQAGKVVEFTKPGYRRPSCNTHLPDWTDVRLSSEDERERIVMRSQASALSPGKHSCFRVGSIIALNSPDKRTNGGMARVLKISLVQIDKLESKYLKGSFFSKSGEFFKFYDEYKQRRMKPEHEGIVTIVDLEYVRGSAPDEKEIKEKTEREVESDGYTETHNDGDYISSCNSPWTELLVPAGFQVPILEGRLKSWYRIGDLNCLQHGQPAEVKAQRGELSKGTVRVVKIKKFRLNHLSQHYFNLGGFDYALLEASIKADNKNNSEWITVVDIESGGALK